MVEFMKVSNFYNKNQFVIRGNGEIVFQSYESTIAKINKNGVLTLGDDWNYSKTTLKHLYLFINDYKCDLNNNYYKMFMENFEDSKNKKQYIQKLIDDKKIKVCL